MTMGVMSQGLCPGGNVWVGNVQGVMPRQGMSFHRANCMVLTCVDSLHSVPTFSQIVFFNCHYWLLDMLNVTLDHCIYIVLSSLQPSHFLYRLHFILVLVSMSLSILYGTSFVLDHFSHAMLFFSLFHIMSLRPITYNIPPDSARMAVSRRVIYIIGTLTLLDSHSLYSFNGDFVS